MVWDWRSNSSIISVSNGHEASLISFNPLNSKELCTSGDGENIKFWKMKLGLKKSSLECRYIIEKIDYSVGSKFPQNDSLNQSSSGNPLAKMHLDFDDQRLTPLSHTWLPDGRVLASSNEGNLVVSFNPSSGNSSVWLGADSLKVRDSSILMEDQGDDLLDEHTFMNSNFKNIVALRREILFAGHVIK